jgi:hypothetical protein
LGARTGVTQHFPTLGAEHVVEAVEEFRVVVAQHEANLSSLLAQDQQQVAGLLDDPTAVGVGGHAGQVDASGVELDEEQHVEPLQPDGVDGEEVTGHDSGGLLAEERPPGGGGGGGGGGLLATGVFPALLAMQAVWFLAWLPGLEQGIITGLAVGLVAARSRGAAPVPEPRLGSPAIAGGKEAR